MLTENKLEKNEEVALLTWELYLKENYLQNQQFQHRQWPEQKIQDISEKYRGWRPWGIHPASHVLQPQSHPMCGVMGRGPMLNLWERKLDVIVLRQASRDLIVRMTAVRVMMVVMEGMMVEVITVTMSM